MQPVQFELSPAQVRWTGRHQGNLGHNPPRNDHSDYCCGPAVQAQRESIRPGEWVYVNQVHGNQVEVADSTSSGGQCEADAVVTNTQGVTLSISTADCAPIAMSSREGIVAAVHGGWKGLQAGVIASTAQVMRHLGATDITAALGPCIHPECYEFEEEALRPLELLWGASVRGLTSWGTQAFNLPAAVAAACKMSDVELQYVDEACTACSPDYFSWRKDKDQERQVMLVWRDR